MQSFFDTIVAPITGQGTAAVAVIRLSGPESWEIAGKVFSPWRPEPLRASHGHYIFGDDGIAIAFADGHSYTGEESAELSIHGSTASVRALLDACIAAGARLAEPGEFTLRAFLNGRIDLTQAEAVRETVEARTGAQLRLANLHREGALRRRIERIADIVLGQLAAIEASVDFSEEVGEYDAAAGILALSEARAETERLMSTAAISKLIRRGLRVAIVGPPNAGKSSLLNALLGRDRSIVTDVPGTTRDFVEEQIEVEGIPVSLIDTAGLRDSTDRVEAIGVERTRSVAAEADCIWYVYDSTAGWTASDEKASSELAATIVANKADLALGSPGIRVSALTSDGLPALLSSLPLAADLGHREVAINARQHELLADALAGIGGAIQTIESQRPPDLAVVQLRQACQALGSITGRTATHDMISRIFSDFCVGK